MRLTLDTTARITAIGFYLLAIAATGAVSPPLGLPRLLLPTLMLASPFYVYYSRTPTIETCALAANLWSLAATILAIHGHSYAWFAVAVGAGVLAAMVKLNAAPPFWLAGLAYAAVHPSPAAVVAASIVPMLAVSAGLQWAWRCDRIKARHPFSRLTQLSSLPVQRAWNFGTIADRRSVAQWARLMDRNGRVGVTILACLLLAAATRQWAALACVGLYLSAPLAFWRVHHTHEYYTAANGIFLLAALAFVLAAMTPLAGLAAMVLLLVAWAAVWWRCYRPFHLNAADPLTSLVEQMRQQCSEDEVLCVVGLDWSPLLPLSCRRRALMIPDWPEVTMEHVREAIANLKAHGYRVGAFVAARDCANGITAQAVYDELTTAGAMRQRQEAKRRTE